MKSTLAEPLIAAIAVFALPASAVERHVEDGIIVSADAPAIRVRVKEPFEYVGHFTFKIRDVAEGKRFVFVVAHDGQVERLFIARFEHFLPEVDDWYRYRLKDAMELGGLTCSSPARAAVKSSVSSG